MPSSVVRESRDTRVSEAFLIVDHAAGVSQPRGPYAGCAPGSRLWTGVCNPFEVQRLNEVTEYAQRANILEVSRTELERTGMDQPASVRVVRVFRVPWGCGPWRSSNS